MGDQRSRWSTRTASDDINAPQPEAEAVILGTGENRLSKIEALATRRQAGLIVILEDPADPLNAGAVLRSCDAFGATEAWFIHNGIMEGTSMRPHIETKKEFDLESSKLIDSSASASRWVATRTFYSTTEALAQLEQEGFTNVATCFTQRSKSLYQTCLTHDKLALWVGNEFAGLSDAAIQAAHSEVFIPMRGMIQSLNLSVAAAVCLNEISRQRSMVEDANRWAMSEAEQKKMVEALIMRRRSFRTAPIGSISTSRQDLLEKTWTAIVEKSNRSSLNLLQD
jgi:tRNA (guanosine-2'-O-)-methyltransferase